MTTFDKIEFWKELEATDEDFIKRKLALGGFSPSKKKLAIEWLNLKDEQRRKDRAAFEFQVATKAIQWNRYAALASCATAIIAVVAFVWPK